MKDILRDIKNICYSNKIISKNNKNPQEFPGIL